MSKKIAAVDAEAMNSLFASEMTRMDTSKTAGSYDTKSEGPLPANAQAFTDHEEYLSTLEAVLKEDKKEDFNANDVILD